jgi:transposase
MEQQKDIVLAVDYHDKTLVVRELDRATGEEQVHRVETTVRAIEAWVVSAAGRASARGGRVVWVMESTTGWARVKALLGDRAQFVLANVLQMPVPPKAKRHKTDKVDTGRLKREFVNGELPEAYQPSALWRQRRRLVAARESLTSRQTAVRNWIDRYLAHETWESRTGLWSARGIARLRRIAERTGEPDRTVLSMKLDELAEISTHLDEAVERIEEVCAAWPEAGWLDEVLGIGPVSAVSILSRIGPVERFADAEHLISFAGLAPGIRQSDRTKRDGHLGGGGTDKHLRHYLIEASLWARKIPRYRATYERACRRRGKKIGRLVVARMLLRSLYKMLRDGVRFEPAAQAARDRRGDGHGLAAGS